MFSFDLHIKWLAVIIANAMHKPSLGHLEESFLVLQAT